MKIVLFIVMIASFCGCGGGPGTTPDSIQQVQGCIGQQCQVIFDDGQRGVEGPGYICKGSVFW